MNMLASGVVCVVHLCWLTSHAAHPPAALTVGVTLTFDRSTTSAVMTQGIRNEAEAIWNAYGVALLWSSDGVVNAPLHLDVIVERQRTKGDGMHASPELGRTSLDCAGLARGPIHISMGAIEGVIPPSTNANPTLRHQLLAIATGRVLAHEIGHALLGAPSYHDSEGLMRSSFPAGDLMELNRGRFRLSAYSVGRLRGRLVTLSVTR